MNDAREITPLFAYEIRISGRLDESWSDWFDGFTIIRQNGETVLVGEVPDQAGLLGILSRIGALNVTLISVNQVRRQIGGNCHTSKENKK